MEWFLSATIAVLLLSLAATGLVLAQLRRRAILDHPNERSSHDAPTPRGGGIAVIAVLIVAWYVPSLPAPDPALTAVLLGAVALAVLSWIDDLISLAPAGRFLAQAAIVAATLASFHGNGLIFQGLLPPAIDIAAAGLAWLWFLNLFNFMDGIDAISAVEANGIGIGIALLAYLEPAAGLDPWFGAAAAAAMLGFLWWNRPPARIFLGDVGSVPLGFLLGWLLLKAAAAGYWAPALILPLYYLADATVTLLRRAVRREKVWRAHREHFYQQAIQRGRSHGAVSTAVAGANLVLIALAVSALYQPWPALAAAIVVVVALIVWMRR